MTNDERADLGLTLLGNFRKEKYLGKPHPIDQESQEGRDEIHEDLADFVSYLGHCADMLGVDFLDAMKFGIGMWHAEKMAPDGEPAANDLVSIVIGRHPATRRRP